MKPERKPVNNIVEELKTEFLNQQNTLQIIEEIIITKTTSLKILTITINPTIEVKRLTAIDQIGLQDHTPIEVQGPTPTEEKDTKNCNMSKSKISIFIFFIFLSISAQNEIDALLYSLFDNYSTARVSSLGGSFSALGGNTGSIISNPATLATYRTNEFSASYELSENTRSKYLGENNNTDRHKLNFQNIDTFKQFLLKMPQAGIDLTMQLLTIEGLT